MKTGGSLRVDSAFIEKIFAQLYNKGLITVVKDGDYESYENIFLRRQPTSENMKQFVFKFRERKGMYPVKTGADFMANGGKEKVKANIILEHHSPLYFGSKSAHCTHCGEMFKIGKFTVLNCYKLNQKSLKILPEELLCSSCKINKSEEEWDLSGNITCID